MSNPSASAILADLGDAAPVVETILDILFPGSVATIGLGVKLAQGIAAGVPQAVALWDEINSDVPPTAAELAADIADENSAFNKVMADIDAKLATLPD
jgi:hypothetical protein